MGATTTVTRFLIIFVVLALTSCTTSGVTYDVDVPNPPEVKMRDVKWEVVNIDSSKGVDTYMCLDPHSYTNMSLNVRDLELYMIYQNKILKFKKR